MRWYNPNPKHEVPGARSRRGTRLDLTPAESSFLLNDSLRCLEVPGKRQLVGVREGRIHVFQDDGADGDHSYPATGNEVFTKYPAIAPRIAHLLGTDIKRLSRLRD